MRLQDFFLSTAFMSFALITVGAAAPPFAFVDETRLGSSEVVGNSGVARTKVPVAPVPSPLISEDKTFGSAYFDTLSILNTSNECSEFFGGTGESVDIFNQLIARARKNFSPAAIGISMSGATTNIVNSRTKKEYRLFDKVLINTNGPFYRKRISNSDAQISRIGTFEPNTKEARVLMLLHELGHVVKGANGTWLLANDGTSESLSLENSHKIEEVCGDQIKNIRKTGSAHELPSAKQSGPEVEQKADAEFSNR